MRIDSTGRALQLLSLVQTHRYWPCAELAERLGVAERTIRRDIDGLREHGYAVDTTTGRYGGYRLAAGTHLPPLVLDDDDAVALAVGLRYAAAATIDGIEETSLRSLTKIEALLPSRLRRRVSAVHANVVRMPHSADRDVVDPETLSLLAAACRDNENVRFDYRSDGGDVTARWAEPHQLVAAGHRWYLVAWDRDREDWRTFRLDRIGRARAVGSHFSTREIPEGDAAHFVAHSLGSALRRQSATLAIHATVADLEEVLRFIDHTVVAQEPDRCVVRLHGEDTGRLAMSVARIGLSHAVIVTEPAEVASAVERLALNLRGDYPSSLGSKRRSTSRV